MLTTTQKQRIQLENTRQLTYKHERIKRTIKRGNSASLHSEKTKRKRRNEPIEHKVYRVVDHIIQETEGKTNVDIRARAQLLQYYLDNQFEWLVEEYKANPVHFKRDLNRRFLPVSLRDFLHRESKEYGKDRAKEVLESYFSFEGKKERVAKTKYWTVGKEYAKPIEECRNDRYMFINHKFDIGDPDSLVFRNIAFDFDDLCDLRAAFTAAIPFNVIVMDRYPLKRVESNGAVTKEIDDKHIRRHLGMDTKFQAMLRLTDPVYKNNDRHYQKFKNVCKRLYNYYRTLGYSIDTNGAKIVGKNVFNDRLFNSYLLTEKTWTLEELDKKLDELHIPRGYLLDNGGYVLDDKKYEEEVEYVKKGNRKFFVRREARNGSRDCMLYLKGIYSKTKTFDSLRDFLFNLSPKTRFGKGELRGSEVDRIARSIFKHSFIWRRFLDDIMPGKKHFGQICGTIRQMSKNEHRVEFIESYLKDCKGMKDSAIARELQEVMDFHLGERLSLDYLRYLIRVTRDGSWKKRYRELLSIKEECTYTNVNKFLYQLKSQGFVLNVSVYFASYIKYKLTKFRRFYSKFESSLIERALRFVSCII